MFIVTANSDESNSAAVDDVGKVLHTVIEGLVDNPEKVRVEATAGDRTLVFNVITARDDVGKVIGKKGRIITAIQQLISAVAAKNKNRVNISVVD